MLMHSIYNTIKNYVHNKEFHNIMFAFHGYLVKKLIFFNANFFMSFFIL